jgi:hypothetical protein
VASTTPSPAPSPTTRPSRTPSHTTVPTHKSPTASITFHDLILDSLADPAGSTRAFSFTSDGYGAVSAEVLANAPMNSATLCLAADGGDPVCDSEATPTLTQPSTTVHSNWTITLISADVSAATVDVQLKWPTDHPAISLEQGRFQGSPNPDSMRMLNATFTTRSAGSLSVDASWPPAAVHATLTISDVTGSHARTVGSADYTKTGAISPPYTHLLAARRTYSMTLYDDSPDNGRPNLQVAMAFP